MTNKDFAEKFSSETLCIVAANNELIFIYNYNKNNCTIIIKQPITKETYTQRELLKLKANIIKQLKPLKINPKPLTKITNEN